MTALDASALGTPEAAPAVAAAMRQRRRDVLAYWALALGMPLYVLALWGQVYLDTHVVPDAPRGLVPESHRHWRMRTALMVLIWSILGGFAIPFGFGGLVLIPVWLWYLYRVVKGALYFRAGRPVGLAKPRAASTAPRT